MYKEKNKNYGLGFTSGALLLKDAVKYVAAIQDYVQFLNGNEEIDDAILPINAETSRKRIAYELKERLMQLPDSSFFDYFENGDEKDKNLILFYCICKKYLLITEFMLQSVVEKWRNMDYDLSTDDFQNFLYIKMDTVPKLMEISEHTRYKSAQITLKILKEIGLLQNNQLKKIPYNPIILKAIEKSGDSWFLDILLLSDAEKKEILE